jgi:hypothetical protein
MQPEMFFSTYGSGKRYNLGESPGFGTIFDIFFCYNY